MKKIAVSVVHTGEDFKVLSAQGDHGAILTNHRVDQEGVILVGAGTITYREGERVVELSSGASHTIPERVFHSVTCTTPARFFIVLPTKAKMKFELKK